MNQSDKVSWSLWKARLECPARGTVLFLCCSGCWPPLPILNPRPQKGKLQRGLAPHQQMVRPCFSSRLPGGSGKGSQRRSCKMFWRHQIAETAPRGLMLLLATAADLKLPALEGEVSVWLGSARTDGPALLFFPLPWRGGRTRNGGAAKCSGGGGVRSPTLPPVSSS